jgi:hypothetical protein
MIITKINEEELKNLDIDSAMIEKSFAHAQGLVACGVPEETGEAGREFVIPLVIPEETESGDKRVFVDGSLSVVNDFPIPLMWQPSLAPGHDGAVIVGKITSAEVGVDEESGLVGIKNARGVFDTGAWGKEAQRLVTGGFLRHVSADMDMFEAANEDAEDENSIRKVNSARVIAVTLVSKPAFHEAHINLIPLPIEYEEPLEVDPPDGVYEDMEDLDSVLLASAAPMYPPEEWFADPHLDKPTPLTVDDHGHVFGHIATWNTNHIGMAGKIKPPHSKTNYQYFRTGVVRTEEGNDIPVGHITLTGGHADGHLSAAAAIKHYDDTNSAVCDVAAGEDRFGIWVAGALRPDVTEAQIRAFRASAPSGDWRPIHGRLELVAVCQVNVPGFPTLRAVTASGSILSLCAAGTADLVQIKRDTLEDRVAALEDTINSDKVNKAQEAINNLRLSVIASALK